ncbi:protocadherin-20 [Hippocampus zosterae]|uniref:protocadherin-20 n=1 Tax=Hippocampus zosterae TaxID=109293 RepID=UPI00223E8A32|nr:protocadherin-20 [Hippocampus zosterae]
MVERTLLGLGPRGEIWGFFILFLYAGSPSCFASFSQAKELLYRIKEGLPKGTFIGAIGVDLNLDLTVDPPYFFSLAQKRLGEQYVTLNNLTGEFLTSATEIDRETLCPSNPHGYGCFLSVDVFVLPQQYFQLIKVKMIIEDINDNRPKFPVDEIVISVPENTAVNARYAVEQSAVDPDLGLHGVQTYWLVNDFGVFTLDVEENEGGELTPFIIVTDFLDRETQAEYVTDIIAEDGGTPPLLGAATLKIVILDVNDNCPRFAESHLNLTLRGNATKGTHLARLHAFDPDVGANAQIGYAYSERVPRGTRNLFHLNRTTGVIKLAGKIDAAAAASYKLTVLANGPGCIPAVATVAIRLIKVRTGPPVVVARYIALEKDGVVSIKESEPAYSPIAFFTVKNIDAGHGVDCRLEGVGPFRIGPYQLVKNEFLLETTEPLDYETAREYELVVVAEDSQGLVIETFLKVQILDENDNAPVFRQSLVEISLDENNPPNTYLTQLQATDQDSDARGAVIFLLGGDAPAIFVLDRLTGILSVTTSLDREEKDTYRFVARAVDQGTPRRESIATVVVTVRDRNDNSPRFINKDFTFFVPENFPGYGEIGVLSVTDADVGENSWVALSILNGSDIFLIDAGRGALRAKVSLDREQQGTYQLWIEAVDGGEPALSSVTMVTVLLLDVNDNPPVVLFPQSNQSYMLVLPDTLPGTSITEVYAVDNDTGMNAVIAYSIIQRKGGEPGSFSIDPETGNITLERELSNRGLHSLLVKVSDHGQPEPLYSTVRVNLFVNETVSNESYIRSLLTREADIEDRPWQIGQLQEGPETYDMFPCQPALIALSVTCVGLFFSLVTLTACICLKRFHKRKAKSEVELPLKMKTDSMKANNRKLGHVSNI